jgi:hypothetical protein
MQHAHAARPLFDVYALARIVASSTAGLFFALSALFVVRRMAGGMLEPLPPGTLLLIGATLAAIASFLRLPWLAERTLSQRTGRAARIVGVLLPLPAIVLFGAALSLPGAAVWSIVLLWIGLLVHEVGWGYALWRGRREMVRRRAQASPPPRPASSGESGAPPEHVARMPTALLRSPQVDHHVELQTSPQNVTQQIMRTREDDAETITGVLRAQLEAGERTHSLHVAFCPPLASTPSLQCEQTDGPAATIALGEVQTYGARIDLRLSRPAAKPIAVTVEFYAHG